MLPGYNPVTIHCPGWGTLGVFINALSRAGECDAYREVKGWVVRIGQERLIAAEAEADAAALASLPSEDGEGEGEGEF